MVERSWIEGKDRDFTPATRAMLPLLLLSTALRTSIVEHVHTKRLHDAAFGGAQLRGGSASPKRSGGGGVDDWAGWAPRDSTTAALESSACTIEVRTRALSVAAFRAEFVDKQRPLLLRGEAAAAFSAGWNALGHWSEAEFLAKYGDVLLQGSGSRPARTAAETIRAFHTDAPAMYHWSDLDTQNLTEATLPDFRPTPALYEGTMRRGDFLASSIFLAPPGEGAGFHFHNDAASVLVHGRKRWFMYPPSAWDVIALPKGNEEGSAAAEVGGLGLVSQRQFFEGVYPKVLRAGAPARKRPHECVQRPGDVVYVPEMWSHMTLSIGATVSISLLRNSPWGVRVPVGGDSLPKQGPVTKVGHSRSTGSSSNGGAGEERVQGKVRQGGALPSPGHND